MRPFFGLLAILATTVSSPGSTKGAPIDFCRLVAAPEDFAGRVVSFRASIQKHYHGIELYSEKCDGLILLELRANVEVPPKREVALAKDSNYEKFYNSLFVFKTGTMELKNRIDATFEGRLDSVYRVKGGKRVRVSRGYGQGSSSTTRLVLHKVSDVTLSEKKE